MNLSRSTKHICRRIEGYKMLIWKYLSHLINVQQTCALFIWKYLGHLIINIQQTCAISIWKYLSHLINVQQTCAFLIRKYLGHLMSSKHVHFYMKIFRPPYYPASMCILYTKIFKSTKTGAFFLVGAFPALTAWSDVFLRTFFFL